MRRNLIVVGGVAMVVLGKMFLPLLSETIDGVSNNLSPRLFTNTILLVLVLFVMVFKWTGRGILWILMGLIGAAVVPSTMVALVRTFREINDAFSLIMEEAPRPSEINYLPGMYVLILGYVVIVGGGVWDLVQKRKQGFPATRSGIVSGVQQEVSSAERKQHFAFMCKFVDGRQEVIDWSGTEKISIGSGPGDNIQTSPAMSTKSQVVVRRGKNLVYLDVMDTTFPTKFNEQMITNSRRLNLGDVIKVGDAAIVIRAPD